MLLRTFLFAAIAMLLLTAGTARVLQSMTNRLHKTWMYRGEEEFGVFTPADTHRAKDYLELRSDGTFAQRWQGKAQQGTYQFSESTRQLTLTGNGSPKKLVYAVKRLTDSTLVLEHQSVELVRTRYSFRALPKNP